MSTSYLRSSQFTALVTGVAIGIALTAATGSVPLGMGTGLAIGVALRLSRARRGSEDPPPDQ